MRTFARFIILVLIEIIFTAICLLALTCVQLLALLHLGLIASLLELMRTDSMFGAWVLKEIVFAFVGVQLAVLFIQALAE